MSGIIYSSDIVLTDQKLFRRPVNVILWWHLGRHTGAPRRREEGAAMHISIAKSSPGTILTLNFLMRKY